MSDYIWLDDKSPILSQLSNNFKSAAILFHPFIQMPFVWEKNKRKSKYEHISPTDKEIFLNGKPVKWETGVHQNDLENIEELAIALKTSISALMRE